MYGLSKGLTLNWVKREVGNTKMLLRFTKKKLLIIGRVVVLKTCKTRLKLAAGWGSQD